MSNLEPLKGMPDSCRSVQHDSPRMSAGDFSTDKVIMLLDTLLAHTVPVRDLYKSARCQAAGSHFRHLRSLFDAHYEDQLRLVDVLVDRICALGGASRVLVGTLLQGNRHTYPLRGHLAPNRLLCDLLEAHELLLETAQTAVPDGLQTDTSPDRDFAVGRVILTNNLQEYAVREQLIRLDQASAQWKNLSLPPE
jgi:starvation-inducible DNA-binding protein